MSGRYISPYNGCRCVLFGKLGCIHQHIDIRPKQCEFEGCFRTILVWHATGKIVGTFQADSLSCYNAFSRVDMRVQVQIPGTVESYCVDERGNKLEATEEHWLETYLCSVLRAYSYADNGSGDVIKRIIGVRRFNPITSTEQEQKFLDAAEKLFFSG